METTKSSSPMIDFFFRIARILIHAFEVNAEMPLFLRILIGTQVLYGVYSMYFFLKEGDEKCFIRELPVGTLLIADYRCTIVASDSRRAVGAGTMMVEVKNPHRKTILSREYGSEGMFSFTSNEPGEHTICMHSKAKSGKKMKVDFGMQVGERTINYTSIAKKGKLTEIETKYKQLNEKALEIIKELDYLRYREEMFRESTEAISRRVLLWAVVQTVVLIMMAMWQTHNLQLFFESKKLV